MVLAARSFKAVACAPALTPADGSRIGAAAHGRHLLSSAVIIVRGPIPLLQRTAPACATAQAQQVMGVTFLGLLAKIKCSICSYQFNI